MLIADAEAILRLLQLRSYLYLACIDNWRSAGEGRDLLAKGYCIHTVCLHINERGVLVDGGEDWSSKAYADYRRYPMASPKYRSGIK